ncbi:MAG: adenylate/guanylate cyclase domain-containing protein [Spirochaetia bacterium]|nr:adenylate/guanylate cyclase domain-containing protein [Spirochaetia bacterium]
MGDKARIRTPYRRFVVISAVMGFLIAFGYNPLSRIIGGFLSDKIHSGPWNELITISVLGIACIGGVIYISIIFSISLFTGNLRDYLIKSLDSKKLLPFGFKLKRRGGFRDIYGDIIGIFNYFIEAFLNLKQGRDSFAKTVGAYLDPALKKELEGRGSNEIYLGGKTKTATIFFSDLRGFTHMTESSEPERVIKILNDYFSMATKIIEKNNGTVNKYIGDAVMAVFEEPPKYRDFKDADKAVISALDIQEHFKVLLAKWNREKKPGEPELQLGLGVGLARGEVIAGNIGSEERMEYTVIGDTVNFASRLCGKAANGQVIVPENINKMLERVIVSQQLPDVEVKGKSGLYKVYNVITRKMIV